MSLQLNASAVYTLKNPPLSHRTRTFLTYKPNRSCYTPSKISCSINLSAGQSDDPKKLNFDRILNKAKDLWDNSPEPVKIFPWNKTLDNFIQIILDLILAVIKYLSIPIFAVTSISEMSYCAHERKLFLIPIPFLIGVAIAGVLRNAALESSPYLKTAEVPWHLIAIILFFALLKFPGPYYPYWGRIFIPHLVNGALLRTLWFMFVWYRRPLQKSEKNVFDSTEDSRQPNGT